MPTRRDLFKMTAGGLVAAALPSRALASTPPLAVRTATIGAQTRSGDGTEIMAQATGPAQLRARLWPDGNRALAVTSDWHRTPAYGAASVSNAVKIALPTVDLHGHSWEYEIDVAPRHGSGSLSTCATRRIPFVPPVGVPTAFRFGFGACAQVKAADPLTPGSTVLPLPTIAALAGRGLLFYAHIGDMGYLHSDDPGGCTRYDWASQMFRNFRSHPDVAPLYDEVIGDLDMTDDHDAGLDDGDGAWYQANPENRQAFADLAVGYPRPPHPAYRRRRYGNVEVFLADCRTYSDPLYPAGPTAVGNGKYRSNLGTVQRDLWLKPAMASSTADIKILLSPRYFREQYSATNLDHSPAPLGEQGDLLDFFTHQVSGFKLICSGDRHAAAFVKYADDCYEILANPSRNDVHHPINPDLPGVLWAYGRNTAGPPDVNLVGQVDIDPAAGTVGLHWVQADGSDFHYEKVALP